MSENRVNDIESMPAAGSDVAAVARAHSGAKARRQHSEQFRQELIEEASRPGVTVSSVASAHELNAEMLRRWIKERAIGLLAQR